VRPLVRFAGCVALAIAAGAASPAHGDPGAKPATARLAAIAPADDVRKAIVIGAGGEIYEPDGKGAWIHRRAIATADRLTSAGRTGGPGGSVVALGDGVVYRLASNGWSAIRLAQRGKAILGSGARSLAAVGRQLFALDSLTRGEPTRLAVAPANIVAIGSGARATVIATDAGAWRLEGKILVPLKSVPPRLRLISDRWAIVDRGAVELTAARTLPAIAWPTGIAIGVAGVAPDGALVAIGSSRAGLELLTLRAGKLARDPLGIAGTAVGVVVDRAGRAAVALSDGRVALRSKAGWTTTEVRDEAPAEHPGAPPATSS
jgi:hypothetical protein